VNKPSVLVFDLDGTLIDSHQDIAQAVNHVLVQSDRAPLSAQVITSYVGDGARKLLERAASLTPESPELSHLLAGFLEYYNANATIFTTVYPQVRETLDRLQRTHTLALCTNKPRVTTDRVLLELELAPYFASVVAGDDLPHQKPHPAPLLHIAQQQRVNPNALAMIGDGPQDIQCGRAVGAFCVGVVFGMKPPDAMLKATPDHVVTRFADLAKIFAS
jgi:phosphoglycolate phosphatase